MNVVYPDASLLWMLNQVANTAPGLIFHLFNNVVVPGPATVLADLAPMDAVFPPITVPLGNFTFQQVTAHVGSIQAGNIAFTNTSGVPQTVYGFYVTDGGGSVLVQVANFDNGPLVVPNGNNVPVTPILGGYSGNQS